MSDPAVEPTLAPAPDHDDAASPRDVVAAAVGQPTAAEYVAAAARLAELTHQYLALRKEIGQLNHYLRIDGSSRPLWECLRCGARWLGHRSGIPPLHCARCHTSAWNVAPGRLDRDRTPEQPGPEAKWKDARAARKRGRGRPPTARPVEAPVAKMMLPATRPSEFIEGWVDGLLGMHGIPPPPPPISMGIELPPLPPPPPRMSPRPLADRLRELSKETPDHAHDAAAPPAPPPEPAPTLVDERSDPQRLDRDDRPAVDNAVDAHDSVGSTQPTDGDEGGA
jgi:hypothetical protein